MPDNAENAPKSAKTARGIAYVCERCGTVYPSDLGPCSKIVNATNRSTCDGRTLEKRVRFPQHNDGLEESGLLPYETRSDRTYYAAWKARMAEHNDGGEAT